VVGLVSVAFGGTVVPGGDVFGTWSASGSPYEIQGDVGVPADSVLVIEPGVDVVFEGDYALVVSGALTAVGTAQDSIRFTAPDRQEWRGLGIEQDAGPVQLAYCIVERGAAAGAGVDRDGGGIHCAAADFSIANSTIRNNRAVGWGGGLYCSVYGGAPLTIADCAFRDNQAEYNGGGVHYFGPELILTQCQFAGNATEGYGGGVYCFPHISGSVEITDCSFDGNESHDGGGGVNIGNHATQGVTLSNCDFSGNYTIGSGGGLRLDGTADATIDNCSFAWNSAGTLGGSGVFINSGTSVFSHCTFDRNLTSGTGALYCDGTDAEIESCTFSSNYGNGFGMDLRLMNGTISVVNTVVSGNAGGWTDPSLYFGSGTFSVQYCDLFKRDAGDFAGPGIPPDLGDLVGVNALGDPCDAYSNILLDPFFCDRENGDLRVAEDSPCLSTGEGGVDIGAHGIGCETLVRPATWGGIKALFR